MRPPCRPLVKALARLSLAALVAVAAFPEARATPGPVAPRGVPQAEALARPFDSPLKYPFTESASRKIGVWKPGSQDYPYFGAPRDGNLRRHGGVDLYPLTGAGTPIQAMQDGTVIRNDPFYIRHSGEVTYALLIDHGGYVAHYAELVKPALGPGDTVRKGQVIGFLSGTRQLHFGLYQPGTRDWWFWRGERPPNLLDPTEMMLRLFRKGSPSRRGA